MVGGVEAGPGVFDEDQVVVALACLAGGRCDANVCGDAAEHDRGDAASAQLHIEVGAKERTPVVLGYHDVSVFGAKILFEYREVWPGSTVGKTIGLASTGVDVQMLL